MNIRLKLLTSLKAKKYANAINKYSCWISSLSGPVN